MNKNQKKGQAMAKLDPVPKTKLTNPNKEPLTAKKLLSFPGCENYSFDEATQIAEDINHLAFLLYEYHHIKSICIDNQQTVNLNGQSESQNIIPIYSKNKVA